MNIKNVVNLLIYNLIKINSLICSLRSLLKDLKNPHSKVKSGDLSIMHDSNVMPRRKSSVFRLAKYSRD